MMYHNLDLADIQRIDNAERSHHKPSGPPSVNNVEEITYPRVSHGKPHIFLLFFTTI